MMELTDHPAQKYITALRRGGVVVDYAIFQHDTAGRGLEEHRLAADMAMRHISERWEEYVAQTMKDNPKLQYKQFKHYHWDVSLATATPYPAAKLLEPLTDPYYVNKPKTASRTVVTTEGGEYAYAFLEPPYANKFVLKDWMHLNALLFSSPDNLEVYRWTDNWSNYFEDGKEWWGTFFWTVFDRGHGCFVVIAASSTD